MYFDQCIFCGNSLKANTIYQCVCGADISNTYQWYTLIDNLCFSVTFKHYDKTLQFELDLDIDADPTLWVWNSTSGHREYNLSPTPKEFVDIQRTWEYVQRLIRLRVFS